MAMLGNSLEICQHLKGIRFVDTTAKHNQRFRVEIWTSYRDDKHDLLKTHLNELGAFLDKDCGFPEGKKTFKFYNIDREEKKTDKTQKNDEEKDKTSGQWLAW